MARPSETGLLELERDNMRGVGRFVNAPFSVLSFRFSVTGKAERLWLKTENRKLKTILALH
jgi:hypothetical protein